MAGEAIEPLAAGGDHGRILPGAVRQRCIRGIAVTRVVWQETG